MPDRAFNVHRLARLYDPLDPDRTDLEVYAGMAEELEADSLLDVGCGTGTFACQLALRGLEVVGLDPASASLDVARGKPGADLVRWIHGDATTLPSMQVDLATMTGNVAQVFLTDDDWLRSLTGIRAALRPGGRLVLETRDPARKAWLGWNPDQTRRISEIASVGEVETWCEVTEIREPLVSFRWWYRVDGLVLTSDSTLRFRDRDEVEHTLRQAGFRVDDVRDAPDRPGLELVFVASAPE